MTEPLHLHQPHSIEGCFDGFHGVYVAGWAFDSDPESGPVRLAVVVDGEIVAQGVADAPSPHIGEGRLAQVGFHIPLPARFFSGKDHKVGVFAAVSDDKYLPLPGWPQHLGPTQVDGYFDMVGGGAAKGWCCSRSMQAGPSIVELYVDGVLHGQATANLPRADIAPLGIHISRSAFSIPLPPLCSDGRPHTLEVRCQGTPLMGSSKVHQADYEGFIDVLTFERVSGWLVDKSDLGALVKLDVRVGDRMFVIEVNEPREDIAKQFGSPCHGFSLNFPKPLPDRDALDITITVHGTDLHLTEQPLVLYTERGLKSLKARMACAVLDGLQATPATPSINLSELSSALDRISSLVRAPNKLRLAAAGRSRHVRKPARNIAVVIGDDTVDGIDPGALLASLKNAGAAGVDPMVVLVGPESPSSIPLRDHLEAAGIPCLDEETFIGQHLAGGEEHRSDVLIVPGRCVPPPDIILAWHRQLAANPMLASVSPVGWADAAAVLTQQSPASARPGGVDRTSEPAPTLNAARPQISFLNRPRTDMVWLRGSWIADMDTPSATTLAGFLANLAEEQTCRNGLHALSDAVCMPVNDTLRPEDFLSSEDHAAYLSMADRIAEKRLADDRRPTILHVLHGLGGGIVAHCEDVAELTAEAGVRSLLVRATAGPRALLVDPVTRVGCRIDLAGGIDDLIAAVAPLNVKSVHLHHVLGHPDTIWELPKRLGVPIDITVHDYYWICPRVTLMDETERYCGEPPLNACAKCVLFGGVYPGEAARYEELGGSVAAWRRYHCMRLESARSVFVPSLDVLERMRRYCPTANLQHLGHAEPVPSTVHACGTANSDRIGVAVIGGIGVHKGFEELIRLVRWSDKRNLHLQFHVIGSVPDPNRFAGLNNVVLNGSYARKRLPDILASAQCQLALFLSVWPETYCYTLSEALAAGLIPVGYDIGAVGDRIRGLDVGITVPHPSSPEQIVQALMDAYDKRSSLDGPVPVRIGVSREDYRDDYLRRLGLSPAI